MVTAMRHGTKCLTWRRLRLAENTLVVLTSDNGGAPRTVAPLRGSKGSLYEGGIRVPCVVWGAGVQQPGRASDEPILTMDFYPTLADLASAGDENEKRVGRPSPQPIDGVSLLPILAQTGRLEREALFWHFPCYVGRSGPASAIRAGEWKLIEWFEDSSLELYNLRDDPGETRDLADVEPERFGKMCELLRSWQLSVKAPLPGPLAP